MALSCHGVEHRSHACCFRVCLITSCCTGCFLYVPVMESSPGKSRLGVHEGLGLGSLGRGHRSEVWIVPETARRRQTPSCPIVEMRWRHTRSCSCRAGCCSPCGGGSCCSLAMVRQLPANVELLRGAPIAGGLHPLSVGRVVEQPHWSGLGALRYGVVFDDGVRSRSAEDAPGRGGRRLRDPAADGRTDGAWTVLQNGRLRSCPRPARHRRARRNICPAGLREASRALLRRRRSLRRRKRGSMFGHGRRGGRFDLRRSDSRSFLLGKVALRQIPLIAILHGREKRDALAALGAVHGKLLRKLSQEVF
mmetsp:Transcript_90758/g.163844  ORF Transcript_90758/g.163844 Transcript_90758/m.163844 type:complete len:307 (-) Transcript_90758:1444-2364(-)